MFTLIYIGALTLILYCIFPCTIAQQVQPIVYVDSEYKGSISTGDEGTPYTTFQKAFEKACSQGGSSGSDSIIIFVPRAAPYSITSRLFYSSCGAIKLRISQQSEGIHAQLVFSEQFKANNISLTFERFEFSTSDPETISYKESLNVTNGTIVFSNCIFRGNSSGIKYFLYLEQVNLTINSSVFHRKGDSLGNIIRYSQAVLSEIDIYFEDAPLNVLFECYGAASETSMPSSVKAINIRVLPIPNSKSQYNLPGKIFYIGNTKFDLANTTISNANAPILNNSNAANHLVIATINLPNFSFRIRDLTLDSSSSFFPFVRIFALDEAKNLTVNLDSIKITRAETRYQKESLTSSYGLFHIAADEANVKLCLNNLHILDSQKLSENPIPSYNNINFFYLNLHPTSEIKISNLSISQSALYTNFFYIMSCQKELLIENVSISSSILYSKFLRFEPEILLTNDTEYLERQNWVINNFEIKDIQAYQTLFSFNLSSEGLNPSPYQRELIYVNVTGMKIERLGIPASIIDSSVAVFQLIDVGIKVYSSSFQSIAMSKRAFVSVEKEMVPVLLKNNRFENFIGYYKNAGFLSKSSTEYSQESLYPDSNGTLKSLPFFNSFCLLNNTFSGNWTFSEAPQVIGLKAQNAFIINNTFRDFIAQIGGDFISMKDLHEGRYTEKMDPATIDSRYIDPEVHSLFKQYIKASDNISSIFAFDGNKFERVSLGCINLIYTSNLIQNGLFLFQNNIYTNGAAPMTTKTRGSLVLESLIKVTNTPKIIIRNNTLTNSNGSHRFLEASTTYVNDSSIQYENNVFSQSHGIAPLLITGSSFELITFSNNSVSNCTTNALDMIKITVSRNLQRDLDFSNNSLQSVSINLTEFDEVSLIKLDLPTNLQAQILITNLTVINCNVSYDHGKSDFGVRSTLIYIMNPNSITKLLNSRMEANCGRGIMFFMIIYAKELEINSLDYHSNPPDPEPAWESSILISAISFNLTNSRASCNTAAKGGLINFENLLTSGSQMMNISIFGNEFSENAANYGGVFYFSPNNAFMLNFQANSNKFLHNSAFISGGVFYLETQTIYSAEIANSEYGCYDYLIYEGAFLSAGNLRSSGTKETSLTIKNMHLKVSVLSFIPSLGKIRSFIHISPDLVMLHGLKYTLDNITLYGIASAKYFDTSAHLVYALGSTIRINNLNISHMVISWHAIVVTSATILSISDSIFNNNVIKPSNWIYGKDSCLIKVDQQLSNLDAARVNISNTTFYRNVFEKSSAHANLICIDSINFYLSIMKNTRVLENQNTAPVLFDKIDRLPFRGFKYKRKILLADSIFEDNNAETNYGGILFVDAAELKILNCYFSDNYGAYFGGAISILNPQDLFIESSKFRSNMVSKAKNTAGETPKGGALYIEFSWNVAVSRPNITITQSDFKGNLAFNGQGGVLYLSSVLEDGVMRRMLDENTFELNYALAGNDISTCVSALELNIQSKNDSTKYVVSGLRSRELFPQLIHNSYFNGYKLKFAFLDFFNNSLVPLGNFPSIVRDFALVLSFDDMEENITSRECTNGWCILSGDNINVLGAANDTKRMNATLKTSSGGAINFNTEAKVRKCQIGEINMTSKRICVPCEPGFYSVNSSEKTCHECPIGMKCLGGNQIIVKAGYWRANNRSGNVYPCEEVGYCKEGSHGNEICTEGRIGPFCLVCDIQNDYMEGISESCAKCPASWLATLLIIAYNIAVVLIEVWFVSRMRKINNVLNNENELNEKYLENLSKSGYLSIFLLYIQILSIIEGLPSFATKIVQKILLLNPSQTLFYSLNCILKNSGMLPEQIYYWKLGLIVTLPFIKIAGFVTYGAIARYFDRLSHLKSYIVVVVTGVVLIEQPGVVSKIISMFSCQSIDPKDPNAAYFVTIAPVVECWTPEFNAFRNYVALPSLFLWSAVFPCACFLMLLQNRHQLKTKEFARYFGSMYAGYKSKYYLWSQVQMIMIIAITIISQLGIMDQASRGMSIILFSAAYLIYLQAAKPYRFEALYRTDLTATWIYIATTYLAVYGAMSTQWLNEVISIIILITNACFIIFIITKSLEVVGCTNLVDSVTKLINKCFGDKVGDKKELDRSRGTLLIEDPVSLDLKAPISPMSDKDESNQSENERACVNTQCDN